MPAVRGAKKHRWENEDGISKTGRTGAPKTRKLWEEVFSDDTRAFLDYYYFIKTKENEIWVIEEDGEIQSMLQLNPYQLQVAEHPFLCLAVKPGLYEQSSAKSDAGDVWEKRAVYIFDAGSRGNLYSI